HVRPLSEPARDRSRDSRQRGPPGALAGSQPPARQSRNGVREADGVFDEGVVVFREATAFQRTIFENIAFVIRLYERLSKSELDDRVRHALERAALWDEVKDKLGANGLSLYGGKQQRLCIARTVAVRPEVILFDEPCSALDPISTA